MAKKRKAPRGSQPSGPKDPNPADARLAVKTYRDVADEQDQYFLDQDEINFDDEPRSKRLKRLAEEEAFLEPSDEEILGDDDDDEDDESDEEESRPRGKKPTDRRDEDASDEEDAGDAEEEEGDEGWWGNSKKDYYDADVIQTEAEAREEEAEAKRLQSKQLARMTEADFFEADWLADAAAATAVPDGERATAGQNVVTEILQEPQVTDDMTLEDRNQLLRARYPEFDYLADELRELRPVLETLQKEAENKEAKSLEVVKYRVLGCYVATLGCYFAVLTSPVREDPASGKPLSSVEIRDHEVMEALVQSREAWLKVKGLRLAKSVSSITGMLSPPEDVTLGSEVTAVEKKKKKPQKKAVDAETKAQKKAAAEKAKKAKAIEDSLADLSGLLDKTKKKAKKAKTTAAPGRSATGTGEADDRSDFGEEEEMDAHTAAIKAQRKKSLRFYTSQIVQKAARRNEATRDAGGDMDIPHRERLRDRQDRLLAEAQKRGQRDSKFGASLGDDGESGSEGDDDNNGGNGATADDDEYYDMVAGAARQKKADKAARQAAVAAARRGERVVERAEVGADGKRSITYAIEANKGLMPRRKKEVRNPRVKKRMKFEEKKKKLRSMRPVYSGGEGRGGYQGEKSGIKTHLVKSVKL